MAESVIQSTGSIRYPVNWPDIAHIGIVRADRAVVVQIVSVISCLVIAS